MNIPNSVRVKPGDKVKLSEWDPQVTPGLNETEGRALLQVCRKKLDELQYNLYAENQRSVLVIFQAMDTAGKDGVIRDVFEGVNPVSIKVHAFKAPGGEETRHDFLWRHHAKAPPKGEIGVHNRSHYESVLVERVRELVPKSVWQNRYERINEFERMLAESGTLILKFFLHISKDEQYERLLRRLEDPRRNWKFNPGDVEERKYWDGYRDAYDDVLERCSTAWAPWHIVRSNKKWYRNAVVAQTIVTAMENMDLKLPKLSVDPRSIRLVR